MQNNQFTYTTPQNYTILGSKYGLSNGLNSVNNGSISYDNIITNTIDVTLQKNVQQDIFTPSDLLNYKKYIVCINGTITYDITESIDGNIIFSINDTDQILRLNEHDNNIVFCYYFLIDPTLSTTIKAISNANIVLNANITFTPY